MSQRAYEWRCSCGITAIGFPNSSLAAADAEAHAAQEGHAVPMVHTMYTEADYLADRKNRERP